jgi:hypothetical protein
MDFCSLIAATLSSFGLTNFAQYYYTKKYDLDKTYPTPKKKNEKHRVRKTLLKIAKGILTVVAFFLAMLGAGLIIGYTLSAIHDGVITLPF